MKTERQVVEDMFRAMQMGPEGGELMMSLFAENATFIESFTGTSRQHNGKAQIQKAYVEVTQSDGPADLALHLERLDVKPGGETRADWNCTSSAFPTPMRGYDLMEIRDGLIHRLEIVVTEMPSFAGERP